MKRAILTLAVLSSSFFAAQPAGAQSFGGYGYGYPAPYGAPAPEQYPVLKRVLIGAGIFGLGFVAGRATVPQYGIQQPNYGARPSFGGFQPSFNRHHRAWR